LIAGTDFPAFRDSLSAPVPHSIRFNPKKIQPNKLSDSVVSCSTGFYLEQRPIYTLDPLLHAGAYYVQEASSMFLEQYFLQTGTRSKRVLDLCAAPGGKSTHLSSLLSDDSLLVSNEVIHTRAQVLSENLKKWGNPNVIVTSSDPRDFSRLPGFFDIIVVDAPCSGEGLFRRDPSSMEEWSEASAALCAQRQKRILADVWPSLAEGGMLIYSTCTYNPAENEENITWLSQFAQVEAVELKIPSEWGVVLTDASGFPCYRFYPHLVRGEGFFTAAVRKKERIGSSDGSNRKSTLPLASKAEQISWNQLLRSLPLSLVKFEQSFLAFPTNLLSELDQIKASLRIIHAGVKLGESKQSSLIPAHELAVSTIGNQHYFPAIDLSLDQALRFLKREEFRIEFQANGWHLITYKKIPLGWAKNIGNRFNNNYPKEWRIRMTITEYFGERLANEANKFPFKEL